MARQGKRSRDDRRDEPGEAASRGGLLPAGGLLVAVLAVLVLAAVLQTDEDTTLLSAGGPEPQERAVPSDDSAPPARTRDVEDHEVSARAVGPASEPAAPPGPDLPEDLERRAAGDFRRLAESRSGWTLQLALVCEPDNVRQLLRRTGDADRLFVVPADHRGRSCYRVCWGVYPTREQAAAGGLPPGLPEGEIGQPVPQPVAVVVP